MERIGMFWLYLFLGLQDICLRNVQKDFLFVRDFFFGGKHTHGVQGLPLPEFGTRVRHVQGKSCTYCPVTLVPEMTCLN